MGRTVLGQQGIARHSQAPHAGYPLGHLQHRAAGRGSLRPAPRLEAGPDGLSLRGR